MAAKVFGNFYPGISCNKKKRAALIEQQQEFTESLATGFWYE